MIRVLSAAVFALAPFDAHAEPQPAILALMPYMDGVAPCLDAATTETEAHACVGKGAVECMTGEPDGETTLGMMFCTLAENEAWDRLLNSTYVSILEGMHMLDADEAELFPEFANRADSLREAQRAWITWRDADCALEYAIWGAGSMRQIAGAACRLERTSDRTIFLRFLGAVMRG